MRHMAIGPGRIAAQRGSAAQVAPPVFRGIQMPAMIKPFGHQRSADALARAKMRLAIKGAGNRIVALCSGVHTGRTPHGRPAP